MKIVIWTGPAWETWGHESLRTGVGGSETAAIYLSTELARLGHEVEVVGQVHPRTYWVVTGRVKYVDSGSHEQMISAGVLQPECDVFVSSRQLAACRILAPRAALKVLWMHDVHAGPDNGNLMGDYDLVFCLSKWAVDVARRFYPKVPPERFVQTRNGIDTSLYLEEPRKEGWKVVYSSSPDRGLDKLLDYWPAIRELRPGAELHVYYGFDTWEKMAVHYCDDVAFAQIQIFKTRLANMADQGVVTHGRVGQVELAQAWLGASAWLYPTNFSETSCITAMEAQAAGALCVCSRLAALPETAQYAHLVDPPNTREGYRGDFLAHVEAGDMELDPRTGRRKRVAGREWALRELGWDRVARKWDEIFQSHLKKGLRIER